MSDHNMLRKRYRCVISPIQTAHLRIGLNLGLSCGILSWMLLQQAVVRVR